MSADTAPSRVRESTVASSGRGPNGWVETAGAVSLAAAVAVFVTWPALHTHFFSENFQYLGQYRAHGGRFWAALLSPTDRIFFRPVFFAFSLPWYSILPDSPAAYHLRNLAFVIVNLLLLHRLLLRLVKQPGVRWLALILYASSKVHFTTVGYLNIFDSIVMSMLLLASLLFTVRFCARPNAIDGALVLVFCVLSIFSKDFGLVVVVPVAAYAALVGRPWRADGRRLASGLAVAIALSLIGYAVLRHSIVKASPEPTSPYRAAFRPPVAAKKSLIFASTLANCSFFDDGTTGSPGLASVVGGERTEATRRIEWIVFGSFVVLVAATWIASRAPPALVLFACVWIAVYFAPTLLVGNIQIYYGYESIAGFAVLVGALLDGLPAGWLRVWAVAVLVIALNAVVGNRRSAYHWTAIAQQAERACNAVVTPYRGRDVRSVAFVTRASTRDYWTFVLGTSSQSPMLPKLMERPALSVRYLESASGLRCSAREPATLCFDLDRGCADLNERETERPNAAETRVVLLGVDPSRVQVGARFNVQPDGACAIGVAALNASRDTAVLLDGQPLVTSYGGPEFLSAIVPRRILDQGGRHEIVLRDGEVRSNSLIFEVAAP